jgi:DNA-binding MarR family transcriptional regulator
MERAEFVDCLNCRCLAARKEAQRLTRFYDDRMRDFGLTINQFSMLTVLILAGRLPVSALADQLGIDRTTMTRNLDIGERDGLVRTAAGEDRRRRMVEITQRGLDLARQALPAWREAQAAVSPGK